MRPLRVFMCEDEDISAKINRVILLDYMKKKKINVDLTYYSSYKGQNEELFKHIDLAILDIDLGDSILNGIELAKRIQKQNEYVVIIFITAYESYALQASQIHLSGFLAKPVNPHDFQHVLKRAIAQISGYELIKRKSRIVTFHNGKVILREKDIISIEKIPKTSEINIITTSKNVQAYESIKDVERKLSDSFVKLNRSVIVNLSYITRIEYNIVTMNNETTYVISARQMKSVSNTYADFVEVR